MGEQYAECCNSSAWVHYAAENNRWRVAVDRLLCLEAFIRVAEHQSFVGAARELRVAPSVVSSRVKQFEEFLRVPLFYRSTREVMLSEAGHACFDEGRQLLERFEALADRTSAAHNNPSGVLRLRIIPGMTNGRFGRVLNLFQQEHPNLDFEVTVTNGLPINNADPSFDVSLQADQPSAETQMVARSLFPLDLMLCASPDYLRQFGVPHEPADLANHRVCMYSVSPERNRMRFIGIDNEEIAIRVKDRFSTNSMDVLHDLARAGNGIACLPRALFSDSLESGLLEQVLPGYTLPAAPDMLAVFPVIHREAGKVRLFIDFVKRHFAEDYTARHGSIVEPDLKAPVSVH